MQKPTGSSMSKATADSPNFFKRGSPFLKHPLLTADRTVREVDFLEAELKLMSSARLLDVGCGFGRHAIELGRRGYEVVAIDSSADMIAAARERAEKEQVAVEFRQERGELFLSDTKFDAALCLFTSLGQIGEWGENRGLVARVYAALEEGGQFVLEVPQRETAVRTLKPSDCFGTGERYADVTRQFEATDQSISEIFRVVSPERTEIYVLRYHLFDRAELSTLLTTAGFAIEAAYGAYDRTPLAEEDPIMVFVARKGD
jgi:SAM-dependent methyltransferase